MRVLSYGQAVTGMAGRCGRKHERQGKPETPKLLLLLLQPSSGPCQALQAQTHAHVEEIWGFDHASLTGCRPGSRLYCLYSIRPQQH